MAGVLATPPKRKRATGSDHCDGPQRPPPSAAVRARRRRRILRSDSDSEDEGCTGLGRRRNRQVIDLVSSDEEEGQPVKEEGQTVVALRVDLDAEEAAELGSSSEAGDWVPGAAGQEEQEEQQEAVPEGYMICFDCKEKGASDYIRHKDCFSAAVKRGDYGKYHSRAFCLRCSTGDQSDYVEKLQARAKLEVNGLGDEADEMTGADHQRRKSRVGQQSGGRCRGPAQQWRDPSSQDWFSEEPVGRRVQPSDHEDEGEADSQEEGDHEDESEADSQEEDAPDTECGQCGEWFLDIDAHGGYCSASCNMSASQQGAGVPLDVPFCQKNRAKALGCKWEPNMPRPGGGGTGCWVPPAGMPRARFAQWDPTAPRDYLDVPFAEKDQAKALGAQFDWERKKWWVRGARQQRGFEKWL